MSTKISSHFMVGLTYNKYGILIIWINKNALDTIPNIDNVTDSDS